ncbi:MAG: hypothetical protein M1114_00780, partial [Candidatus Dependentiae bacterium]|nr:hypothetical protein [Candidatus Dependentiae bacterium]
MLSKKNLFLPLFALSFSSFSHTYKVDPKLLRSWTPELEESEHLAEIPYNVMWQREDKKLIYALTTCHPNHQNKFESNVATLRNNYPQAYILHQESLDNYIEQLLTQLSLEEVRTRDLYYCLVTDTLNQIEQFNL